MSKNLSLYFDANGNKAEWQYLVEAEYDSRCEITITAICVWCDVEGYKDWIDQTKQIEKLPTLYKVLCDATEKEIVENEMEYAQYQADNYFESKIDSDIDAYRDSKL